MTFDEKLEALRINIESLHAATADLFEASQRHDAQIAKIIEVVNQDAENIRGLARIAEIHHERLSKLEGGG